MTAVDLEQRWRSIPNADIKPYRSLLISSVCVPELYLALDMRGDRFLILKIPRNIQVTCPTIKMENLSIEWHADTRFILIGLCNSQFADLFNELTLSLYNRIKDVNLPEVYTSEFVICFNKWTQFFDDFISNQLSESVLKGLFGELTILNWYLDTKQMLTDDILNAWQGPYNRAQDFVFSTYNLEIKTKNFDEIYVCISSEHQLEVEAGKELSLGIVNVQRIDEGETLQDLIDKIKATILFKGGDLSIFLKAISRVGLTTNNSELYNRFRWKSLNFSTYECNSAEFPKLIKSQTPMGISEVKYNLNVSVLDEFKIQTIIL